jgi:hypothetical protein
VRMGVFSSWKTASFFGNNFWIIGWTWLPSCQSTLCSNSAMKGNNGTHRILYHDIAAQTITEPCPVFQYWNQAFRIVGYLGCSPNISSSWCREQREGRLIWTYDARVSSCLMSRLYGRDIIIYASEHYFQ